MKITTRCEAVWHEMRREDTPIARDLGAKIADEFDVEVSFHSHDGKLPTDLVLFGARFCGEDADTYFAGRAWSKQIADAIASSHAGAGQAVAAAALLG